MAAIHAWRALSMAASIWPISSVRCTRGATPRSPSASAVATVTASPTEFRMRRVTTWTRKAPTTTASTPTSAADPQRLLLLAQRLGHEPPGLVVGGAREVVERPGASTAVSGCTSRSRRPTVTILVSSVCSDWIASSSVASSVQALLQRRELGSPPAAWRVAAAPPRRSTPSCRPRRLAPWVVRRVSVHATALNVSASQLRADLPRACRAATCATRTCSKVARPCRSMHQHHRHVRRATSTDQPDGQQPQQPLQAHCA